MISDANSGCKTKDGCVDYLHIHGQICTDVILQGTQSSKYDMDEFLPGILSPSVSKRYISRYY